VTAACWGAGNKLLDGSDTMFDMDLCCDNTTLVEMNDRG